MMRKLFAAAAFVALAACSPTKPADTAAVTPEMIAQTSTDLNAFLDTEYEKGLQFSPESLTSQGRKDLYDKLDDRSQEASEKELAWRRQERRRHEGEVRSGEAG